MPKKMNPNSLENLKKSPHSGRRAKYDCDRPKHEVRVSVLAWEGAQAAAKAAGFSGVSEMLEELGRGNVAIAPTPAKRETPQMDRFSRLS